MDTGITVVNTVSCTQDWNSPEDPSECPIEVNTSGEVNTGVNTVESGKIETGEEKSAQQKLCS